MKKSVQSIRAMFTMMAVAGMAVLSTGCATSGRYVLLKEYGPSVPLPSNPPLKGMTICIKDLQVAPSIIGPDPQTKPEQPVAFSFVPFTSEQSKIWDQEFRAIKRATTKDNWRKIGHVRNGFGMIMSHVHALNDPGPWLADSLKMDLELQGAKVVGPSQADSADISLSGKIQFCRVDIHEDLGRLGGGSRTLAEKPSCFASLLAHRRWNHGMGGCDCRIL